MEDILVKLLCQLNCLSAEWAAEVNPHVLQDIISYSSYWAHGRMKSNVELVRVNVSEITRIKSTRDTTSGVNVIVLESFVRLLEIILRIFNKILWYKFI